MITKEESQIDIETEYDFVDSNACTWARICGLRVYTARAKGGSSAPVVAVFQSLHHSSTFKIKFLVKLQGKQ